MNNKALIKIGGPYGDAEVALLKEKFSALVPDGEPIEIVRDDSLVGGFIAYIGGKIYDNSVSSQLSAVSRSFKTGKKVQP